MVTNKGGRREGLAKHFLVTKIFSLKDVRSKIKDRGNTFFCVDKRNLQVEKRKGPFDLRKLGCIYGESCIDISLPDSLCRQTIIVYIFKEWGREMIPFWSAKINISFLED